VTYNSGVLCQMRSASEDSAAHKPMLLLAVVFCGLLTSYYYAFLLLPSLLAQSNMGPNLYPVWYASRVVLFEHQDPYSAAVTREIQQVMYGESVKEGTEIFNEHRFAYPLLAIFLFAPIAWLPFRDAQALVLVLSLVITALVTQVWIPRRTRPATQFLCIILVLAAPPIAWAVQLRQPSLLFAALLAACVAAIRNGRLTVAGVLGAMATAKPQLAIAVLTPLVVWALSDWWSRKRFVISLTLTECALLAASEWMCPGWLPRWLSTIRAYAGYAGAKPLIHLLPGRCLPTIAGVLLLLAVLVASWKWRNADPQLAIGFSVAAFSVLLPFQIYNQIMLAPAVFWIAFRGVAHGGTLLSVLRGWMLGLLYAEWGATALLAAVHLIDPRTTGSLWALPFALAWVFQLVLLVGMITTLLTRRCAVAATVMESRPEASPGLLAMPLQRCGELRQVR